MTLYRLVKEREKFGGLILDGELMREALGRKILLNAPLLSVHIGDKWPPLSGCFHAENKRGSRKLNPDLYLTEYMWLILSARSKKLLTPLLRKAGEFLPFDCDGEPYYLLVPHHIISVNEDESEHYVIQGITQGTEKVVFRDEDVGLHVLFKTAFDNGLNLYCAEKFKKAVENYDLTGIYFDTNLARAVR